MATFTERLELLITGQSTDAVAALNKTGAATESLTLKQKAMQLASGGASTALQNLGIPAEATGTALKVAAAGAGALAAVKVGQWAKDAADEYANLAGEVRNFSRASGAGAEDSSRWVAALDDLQVSAEAGGKAAFKLGKEVAGGGENLAKFGIEVAKNKDGTTDLTGTLLNVADAYVATTDPAERAALATAAFGKAGKDLAPVLEQGSAGLKKFFDDAERGHQIFTADDLERARQYELALDSLGDTLRGFKLEVGGAVAPVITQIANTLSDSLSSIDAATESVGGLGGVLQKGWEFTPLANALHTVGAASELMQGNFGAAAEEFARSVPVVGGIVNLFDDAGDATDNFADAQTRLKDAQTSVLDLQQQGKEGTKEYADAVREANAAQNEIEGTTRKATAALTDQATALFQASQAALAAASAGINLQAAQLAVNDALDKEAALLIAGQGPTQTAEQYQNDLAQAHLGTEAALVTVMDTAAKKAIADAGPNASAAEIGAAATRLQTDAILSITDSTPGAITALHDLGYAVVTLPDGHRIVITVEEAEAREKINALVRDLQSLSAGAPGVRTSASSTPTSSAVPVPSAGLFVTPAGVAPGELVSATAAPRAVAPSQSLTFNINVTTRGLGADAPDMQRAVVDAVRGYVQRNGRLEGVTR